MAELDVIPAGELPHRLGEALLGSGPALAPVPAGEPGGWLRRLAPVGADPVLVVTTSGSTGHPKAVELGRAAVVASVAATHARLGGPGHWHCPLPLHYVAGAMTLARALLGGGEFVAVDPHLGDLAALPGRNYLSVVPTQLRRALGSPELTRRLARFDAVLLGGAAAPADLLGQAAAAGIAIVRTYGMSETCGGCVYDGRPLDGVRVELGDDDRIRLHTPTAFSGYLARPDLTAAVLQPGPAGPAVWTQDRGRIDAGVLTVLGRLDDVVISGGVNVDLAGVADAARERFGGVAVAAVGIPDPEWGTVVALGIEADVDETAARERLRGSLEPAALPRVVVAGALPRLASGKVDRRALMRLAQQRQETIRGNRA